jgi:cytochrome c oxidase subunit 3
MNEESSALRFPWPNIARQREGVAFGMWTFLGSEVLFFGGLFLSYAVYRTLYPQAFDTGSAATDIFYGTVNTAILLTSSFLMTLALHGSERGSRGIVATCMLATAAFGLAFLGVKGLEYAEDIDKHLVPGPHFPLHPETTRLFFAFYWVSTGIHAIHLFVGIVVTIFLGTQVARGKITPKSTAIEADSLYWHFVDSIWIVLYALIYLPGRSA